MQNLLATKFDQVCMCVCVAVCAAGKAVYEKELDDLF